MALLQGNPPPVTLRLFFFTLVDNLVTRSLGEESGGVNFLRRVHAFTVRSAKTTSKPDLVLANGLQYMLLLSWRTFWLLISLPLSSLFASFITLITVSRMDACTHICLRMILGILASWLLLSRDSYNSEFL